MKTVVIGEGNDKKTYQVPDPVADGLGRCIENNEDAADRFGDNTALLDYFLSMYSSAYTVDLKNDTFTILHMNHRFSQLFTMNGTRADMERFIADHINPEDREMLKNLTDNRYIAERLKHESEIKFTIREQYDGNERTMQVVILRGSDNEHAIIGFMDITDSVRREREANERLVRANRAMNDYRMAMLSSAMLAFTANLTQNRLESGFWVDDEGKQVELVDILGFNPPCEYDRYITEWNRKFVYKDSRNEFRRYTERHSLINAYNAGKREIAFEYAAKTVSGQEKFMRRSITMSRDSGTGDIIAYTNVKDVSDEKRQSMRIIEQTNVINQLAKRYSDIYLVELDTGMSKALRLSGEAVDPDSEAAKKSVYDEVARAYIFERVHPEDRETMLEEIAFDKVREELLAKRSFAYHYRAIINGEAHRYLMRISVLGDENDFDQAVVGFTCEDEERRRESELKTALDMAESASRAKTVFLNNMSHDIRTPMNAIIGYTTLAASHIENKEQVLDYLTKISQSSAHLLSLINDVLDMSRIESGKLKLNEKPERIGDIVHSLKNIVQADVQNKQLDFFIDSVDVYDENIICDRLRLNQILLNVISNAIKYTPSFGSVALCITEKEVSSDGFAEFEFNIKDTGIGMSPEYVKTIFEPFSRENTSTVSGIQGTGLGMAITKNIIDMLGGKITVSSVLGKGTDVVIRLRFRICGARSLPKKVPDLIGVRGLVVDDDTNVCRSVEKMLIDIGLRPDWCTSGREAVVRTEDAVQLGDPFGVYIIDWLMPDMNGIETARRIRKVVGDEAPIIILTAYDWSDIEEEAREAGVMGFISKPMFPSDLHKVLAECCGVEDTKADDEKETFDFAGRKVLLVEDNEMNREIATAILEENGFVVDTADDGTVGVEKVAASVKGQYDVVLMDIQMPIMNGYKATKAIREMDEDWKKNVPIIAMTANAFEEDRQLAFEAGMNEHIAKPIDIEKLKNVLAEFVK